MKTADLSIGMAVAYDTWNARDTHNLVEAYVMAFRPKQNNSSYWGPSGNSNTVGIAYKHSYMTAKDGSPIWREAWVRPQSIHFSWAEYSAAIERDKQRQAQDQILADEAKADRAKRIAALPKGVLDALDLNEASYYYSPENLVRDGDVRNYRLTLDRIEAVVKAARASLPETIQKEVEAALALL